MYKPADCSTNQSWRHVKEALGIIFHHLSFMVVLISMKGKSPEESSDFIGEMLDVLRAIVSAVRDKHIYLRVKNCLHGKNMGWASLVLVCLDSLLNKMVMFVANVFHAQGAVVSSLYFLWIHLIFSRRQCVGVASFPSELWRDHRLIIVHDTQVMPPKVTCEQHVSRGGRGSTLGLELWWRTPYLQERLLYLLTQRGTLQL